MTDYSRYIGKKVCKESGKPFKSGLKENTVKEIIEHPTLKIPAFTFVEDESFVECRQCAEVVDETLNKVADESWRQIDGSYSL